MGKAELFDHLAKGLTTVCRCWAITKTDGETLGFTDHDLGIDFEGLSFKASSGLTAAAIEQATGLSIDNTEAMGVLSDAAIREEDIEAGRFDGAEVRAWLVNWADPDQRLLQFRGSIGELRRAGGAFHAELRGLTDLLNRPLGRIYQKPCTAVLGDGGCRFDLTTSGYWAEAEVLNIVDGAVLHLDETGQPDGWYARGRVDVLSGTAIGLWGMIKRDFVEGNVRVVELWTAMKGGLKAGDRVRLTAGCEKRMETCRLKFNNMLNFRGFPDIPNEDWLIAVPKKSQPNTGGSRR